VWDRYTSVLFTNTIVWRDKEPLYFVMTQESKGTDLNSAKTGLVVDAYFSATKIKWMTG
jgi:glycerol kinase